MFMAGSGAWVSDNMLTTPTGRHLEQLRNAGIMLLQRAIGGILLLLCLSLLLSLMSYNPQDPSLNTSTSLPIRNWLGQPGAILADLLLQWFGLVALTFVLPIGAVGLQIMQGSGAFRYKIRLWWMLASAILLTVGLSLLPWSAPWQLNKVSAGATLAGAFGRIISPAFRDLGASVAVIASWTCRAWLCLWIDQI
jgi:hypothetical protein